MRSSDLPGEPGRSSSMFLGLDAGAARPHRRVEAGDRDQPINVRGGLARSAGNIGATRLPDTKRRTTSARPSATSAIETLRSIVAPAGVSGLGGGNPARAMVADVQPIHHPPQTSRSARQVGASSRRRPRTRIAPHTPAQPMLYTVYVPRSSLIDHRTIGADPCDASRQGCRLLDSGTARAGAARPTVVERFVGQAPLSRARRRARAPIRRACGEHGIRPAALCTRPVARRHDAPPSLAVLLSAL